MVYDVNGPGPVLQLELLDGDEDNPILKDEETKQQKELEEDRQ